MFILKPLEGLVICATGFDSDERDHLQIMCNTLGAEFSLDLTKMCTHLIAKTASGTKYEYALKWNVPVVQKSWLDACSLKSSKIRGIKKLNYIAYLEPADYSFSSQSTIQNENKEPVNNDDHLSGEPMTYLDACVIYFADDFDHSLLLRVKKQIRLAGGTIANVMDGFVTHCMAAKKTLSQMYAF